MAFNEEIGNRLRVAFEPYPEVIEKKMFGGLAFMVQGHMCCGVNGDELMVRVGPDGYRDALAQPHSREMDFTGRALKGFVYVAEDGFATDDELAAWVERATDFVLSQPAK